MIRKKTINSVWAVRAIHVQCLLLSFFLGLSQVFAQEDIPLHDTGADSTTIVALDIERLQDSLAKAYLFISDTRPNIKLDALLAQTTVDGNDFIQWMERMEVLKGERPHTAPESSSKVTRPNWIVMVLFLLILGIGMVRFFFKSMFHHIIYAYYNEQATQDISKEDSVLTSWPYIFLYLLFSLSLGLFLLIYISAFGDNTILTIKNFFSLSVFVAILFMVKILLLRLLAAIFELQRTAREYVSVLYLMYFNSMLILMPFLLIVTFTPVSNFKFLLSLFVVVVSILFIYKFSVTAVRLLGQLKFSVFYLILYLCALEIAPILILVKTLNS